jgi:uncharacterized membrane protein YbaN (DUF454 family)
MREILKNNLVIILGWIFVALGLIGVVLPILPTTPLLIIALALFSKSSPRFHQMLLNNAWFGPSLKEWETTKTLSRKNKYRATLLIIITFSISIVILNSRIELQLMLFFIAVVLLFFLWRINEKVMATNIRENNSLK